MEEGITGASLGKGKKRWTRNQGPAEKEKDPTLHAKMERGEQSKIN